MSLLKLRITNYELRITEEEDDDNSTKLNESGSSPFRSNGANIANIFIYIFDIFLALFFSHTSYWAFAFEASVLLLAVSFPLRPGDHLLYTLPFLSIRIS